MAYRSTMILALSENESLAKECHVNAEKIPALSQKLKIKIDKKISTLGPGDFKVIKSRAKTCELECICNIYSLALDGSGEQDVITERKAATESPIDRQRCIKGWKDRCQLL